MDSLLAARLQMTLTLAFHMVFAAIGIGLPLLLVLVEGLYLRTGQGHYRELAKQWAKVTSHGNLVTDPDNTTTVKNQVVFAFDDMGALITRWEHHSGVATIAGMSQSPKVQFAYDTSAVSTIFDDVRRLSTVTYPNGRIIHYTYGTAGGVDDLLQRLRQINENNGGSPGAVIEQYSYNGAGRMAIADAQQVNYKLNYWTSTANYGGRDRFGRVKNQFWDGYTDGTTTADIDRFKYEYDYAGNPKYCDIDAAIYATNTKDQGWTYDGLERLKTFDKGTLSGTTITREYCAPMIASPSQSP